MAVYTKVQRLILKKDWLNIILVIQNIHLQKNLLNLFGIVLSQQRNRL